MNLSREFVLEHLKSTRKTLSDWIRDLERPEVNDHDGKPVGAYPGGVPSGLSVSSVEGIPVDQLRAELLAIAGVLEALATSS